MMHRNPRTKRAKKRIVVAVLVVLEEEVVEEVGVAHEDEEEAVAEGFKALLHGNEEEMNRSSHATRN